MKTFKEFRRDWVLDPSKEMIIEKEIVFAYDRYKLKLLTIPVVVGQSEQFTPKQLYMLAQKYSIQDFQKILEEAPTWKG